MLRRKYPERRKHINQQGPVKAVRLSLEAAADLEAVIQLWHGKYNPKEIPSISLIINRAISRWASEIRFNEKKLAAAHRELLEESTITNTQKVQG